MPDVLKRQYLFAEFCLKIAPILWSYCQTTEKYLKKLKPVFCIKKMQ